MKVIPEIFICTNLFIYVFIRKYSLPGEWYVYVSLYLIIMGVFLLQNVADVKLMQSLFIIVVLLLPNYWLDF